MRLVHVLSLITVTTAGCYASHGSSDSGRPGLFGDAGESADAGRIDAGSAEDAGPEPLRRITELAGPGLWTTLQPTLAVTADGVVFVTDGRNIYSIADGEPAVHVSEAELQSIRGTPRLDIRSVAVGPDDFLYVLDGSPEEDIYVSDGPHRVSLFADTLRSPGARGFASLIAVETAGEVLLLRNRDGIVRVRPDEATRLYGADELDGVPDCAGQSFAAHGGSFYYLRGCNEDGLTLGAVDRGTRPSVLMTDERADEIFGHSWAGFGSVTARHGPGAVLNARRGFLRVYNDGSHAVLPTEPPLWQFPRSTHGAPIGVDGADNIYVLAESIVFMISR